MEDETKKSPPVETSRPVVTGVTDNPEDTAQAEKFTLKSISLTVNRGQIVAVVGPVGSGKSSLAAALLGEMQQISGNDFIANGKLAYCAQQDLVSRDGEFSRLMQETGIQKEEETDAETSDTMSPLCWGGVERKTLRRTKYRAKASSYSGKGMLVQDEHRTRGTLHLSVYKKYWTEASYIMPLCVLVLYCAVQCVDAFNRYWLAYWTNNHFHKPTSFYLGIYAALGVFFAGLLYSRMLSQLMLGLWTAKKLHESVLESILHAPMSFFDTTPVGRILNRFSADQQAVDETLPFSWVSFLNILFQAFSTIIVISLNTPIFILIFLPTSVLYTFIQQVYRRTARELKRLGSLSISPVYQQFTETLNGLATIRAYQQEDRFMEMCAGKLNVTNRAYMLLQSCNRWLSVRLEFMGNLMVFCAALLAVGLH